ncbi:MAG: ATP-binding protein [Spirochaetales bacterium]|nr:ATP-binding protein [Spirochaetales bacterium]
MNIVVLSGKGGTGKTTISVNLANIAGSDIALLDCDVEEPNSHLFCNNEFTSYEDVGALYPVIAEDICIHCGKCGSFCNFSAILCTKKMNIVMPEMCHDCGGCSLVCPVDAISYETRTIGHIRRGLFNQEQQFIDGILNIGEFSSTKIIEKVLSQGLDAKHRIIDAPPGSACAAVETVEGADLALIVTEPTPFALSDMKMVVEMLENMKIPAAVFINKSGADETELLEYCKAKELKVVGRLPFFKEYGEVYAKGGLLSSEFPEVNKLFVTLWRDLVNEA